MLYSVKLRSHFECAKIKLFYVNAKSFLKGDSEITTYNLSMVYHLTGYIFTFLIADIVLTNPFAKDSLTENSSEHDSL